ncbi:MAG: trehalose 6-phosphate phosphatase [Verrucomicrobiales bacterium]|jgi:trehalose 6-phosphate phosphatase
MHPGDVGLFSDLDGTLSEIVDDPDAVVPVPSAAECLGALAGHLGTVAIVSGRPVSFLERFFAPPIVLSGLYGLEHRAGNRLLIDPTAVEWQHVMSRAADRAREEFGLEGVEDKRYSITVHYRGMTNDFTQRVTSWARSIADETGLDARPAKMSVELHPPTSRSKGDAVEDMARPLRSAIYLGDDVGDLPAFERLEQLHASGVLDSYAVVLVAGDETPPELRAHATDVVSSPSDVAAILHKLLEAAST